MTRSGSTAGIAAVNYSTTDGTATQSRRYITALGRLTFAAGESSKTFPVLVIDNAYTEGDQNLNLFLQEPTAAGLATPGRAVLTIVDNDTTVATSNPVDNTAFFVRQHYYDFLGREPDPAGFAGWQAIINNCPPGDTTCDRIHVSSAFYRSPEFQARGYFVYRFYPVAFGRKPDYEEFVPDITRVSGFLSDAELEAARVAFVNEFMTRPAFMTRYPATLSPAAFVDSLLSTAGVTLPNRDTLIDDLTQGRKTRAEVIRLIAESNEVYNKYYNQAFVVMQYFGYLRRQPDALYLNWIQELDTTGDYRRMINGFMNSLEYRFRFGP